VSLLDGVCELVHVQAVVDEGVLEGRNDRVAIVRYHVLAAPAGGRRAEDSRLAWMLDVVLDGREDDLWSSNGTDLGSIDEPAPHVGRDDDAVEVRVSCHENALHVTDDVSEAVNHGRLRRERQERRGDRFWFTTHAVTIGTPSWLV
jgi:hypothetical protein